MVTGFDLNFDKYNASMLLGSAAQRRFHVMAKPAGSSCNLDCTYCFYLSKETLPDGPKTGRMSDEMLERFIQQYIAGVTGPEVIFSWQGGEPTLAGLDFFRKVIALEKKYAKPGQKIENDLQTNGTLITDGIPFNTLTCVNRFNARKPLDVYRFLRTEVGSTYIQFIPIVEYKGFETTAPHKWNKDSIPMDGAPETHPGHPNSIVTDWSVDAEDWGYFLCKVFDQWHRNDIGKIFVNHFETLVSQHIGQGPQLCVYSEFCGKGVAVENDGGVYSCDHYVYPEYRLGNIMDKALDSQVLSGTQLKFGYAKSETLPTYCRQCAYLTDCWGECPKNRIIRTTTGEHGLNYLCRGFKQFFAHAIPEVDRIVARLKQQPLKPRARM